MDNKYHHHQRLVQCNQKLKYNKINSNICHFQVLIKTLLTIKGNLPRSKMLDGESHSKRRDKLTLLANKKHKARVCSNVKLIQQEAVLTLSKSQLTYLMSLKTHKQRKVKRIPFSRLFRSWVRSKLNRVKEEHTVKVLKLCCNSRFKKSCSIIQEELRY